MFTNLNNGGTYTNVFAANSREHKIVDNGDGTITIFVQGSGVDRWYESNGRLVLVDSGNFRFAIDTSTSTAHPATPVTTRKSPTPSVVRDSTGRNDITDRDFCEDLLKFTT